MHRLFASGQYSRMVVLKAIQHMEASKFGPVYAKSIHGLIKKVLPDFTLNMVRRALYGCEDLGLITRTLCRSQKTHPVDICALTRAGRNEVAKDQTVILVFPEYPNEEGAMVRHGLSGHEMTVKVVNIDDMTTVATIVCAISESMNLGIVVNGVLLDYRPVPQALS